jgi:hypothetical protein
MIQGVEFIAENEKYEVSIYVMKFSDENFKIMHLLRGC